MKTSNPTKASALVAAALACVLWVGCSGGPSADDAGTDAGGGPDAGDAGADAGAPDGGFEHDGGDDAGSGDAGSEDAGTSDAGSSDAGMQPCDGGAVSTGQATFYEGGGGVGNCSVALDFPNYAAVPPQLWAGSAACGTCLEVTGPMGTTEVIVADQCPGCSSNQLDLSSGAFAQIAEPAMGLANVSWRAVPCTAAEMNDVELQVRTGANPYFFEIVVWAHRYPVATVEMRDANASSFQALQRQTYNAFQFAGAAVTLPLTIRVTDVHGRSVSGTIATLDATTTETGAQFPLTCGP